MLERYFDLLQKEMELEQPFTTDVAGIYEIALESGVTVTITEQPPGFHIFATFGHMPAKQQADLLMEMMQGNLIGAGTGKAALGLDGDGKRLTLSHPVETDVTYDEFRALIEDFLVALDYWQAKAPEKKETAAK